ncbi:MAG: hypothetical protein H7Y88_09260 [Phycisphaerales bacterium]|nr:hypothetical protein [Phycisphaerales bacterium]
MVMAQRITQIIPASGWLAVYDVGSPPVQDVRTRPIVCWALMEDQAGTRVVGMDADMVAGQSPRGRFLGYVREGESLGRFKAELA